MSLFDKIQTNKNAAQAILAAAGDNPLTDDQRAKFEEHVATASAASKVLDSQNAARDAIDGIAGSADAAPVRKPKSVTDAFVAAASKGISPMALTVSGDVKVPSEILGGTVANTPRDARFVSSLMGVRVIDAPSYSFLRQTSRTNAAAPVAIGALKPTSEYGIERVTENVQTIAHLTSPVPRQYLEDERSLQSFLAGELLYGLMHAIDDQIVGGDGIAPNLEGLQTAAGVQSQAFVDSIYTTSRQAITLLQQADSAAEGSSDGLAFVMNPADWETTELATADGSGNFLMGGPVDSAARTLWGVPVVVSNSVDAGDAILGKWSDAELVTRGPISLQWTESAADDFEKNHVRFRCEGRYGFGLLKPASFVNIAVTSA